MYLFNSRYRSQATWVGSPKMLTFIRQKLSTKGVREKSQKPVNLVCERPPTFILAISCQKLVKIKNLSMYALKKSKSNLFFSLKSPPSKHYIFSNLTFNFVEFFLQYPTQGNCGFGSDFILMSVLSTYAGLPGRTGYSSKRGQPSGQTAGGNLSLF